VAQSLSIVFFLGLLAALGLVLELTFKAHWPLIVAALRGIPPAPAPRQVPARPRQRRAAA